MVQRVASIGLLFFFSCVGLNWLKFASSKDLREGSSFSEIIGVLDTSFNGQGFVIHNSAAGGNGNDAAFSIAVDSLERIVVTGYSSNGTKDAMVIWRYNPDGSLDTSFNSQGYVIFDSGNGNDYGYDITIDSSGKILVAGAISSGGIGYDMAIWRYNPDGTLDTTFNGVGYVTHHNASGGNGTDEGTAIALDSSGRIVVAGRSINSAGNSDIVVWRYLSNGTLDTSFNSPKGFVTYDGGSGADEARAITIDSGGNILVTGFSFNGTTSNDMILLRYKADGTLDTSFNGVGYVVHNGAAGGNGNDEGRAMVLDSLGKILIGGLSDKGSLNYDMVIWRYNPDGTLDASFNGAGYVVHNGAAGGNGVDGALDIGIDSVGRILVAGVSTNGGGNYDMVIWRYNSDGTLDTSFNGQGYVVHNGAAGGNGNDSGYALALDSLGKILIAGDSINGGGNTDMVLWRYK